MKYFIFLVAAFFLLPLVAARTSQESAPLGDWNVTISSVPAQLEPGEATLSISLMQGDETPVVGEPVWVRISDGDDVFFAGSFVTDQSGLATFTYRFDRPGTYDLTVEANNNRVTLPFDVHGQYLLLFGFLASVFIVFALLLERI